MLASASSGITLVLACCCLFVTNMFSVVNPTSVPASTVNGITVGGGFVESYAREIVRTGNDIVYVLTADDNPCQNGGSGVIRAWKGTGAQAGSPGVPKGFTEQDVAHHPVSAGNGTCVYQSGVVNVLLGPDIRLDAKGIIHLAYIDGKNGNLYYQTFYTSTDTWGSRLVIASGAETNSGTGWPRSGQVALTLDARDVAHVIFATSGTSNEIRYVNKEAGAWSSPMVIFSGPDEMHPSLVTSVDGTIHAAWLDNSLASHATIKYSKYSGGIWSAAETVASGTVLANGDDDQGPSIATDLNSVPHVLYMDGTVNGGDNYVRMRYRAPGGVWMDNTPPGYAGPSSAGGTWYAHTPQNYISNAGDDYVFLGHDVNISPGGYQYKVGGAGNIWSTYQTLDPRNENNTLPGAPGLDGSASIRFDPLRDNNPGIIDVIYYDENDGTAGYSHHATVYYKAIIIKDSSAPAAPTGLKATVN
jgi:hypothetical protein